MQGGCHCGAVRYEVSGEPLTSALCHCSDCRRHSGAPVVAWALFPEASVTVTKGTPTAYASSQFGVREFCPSCGTGLFYKNANVIPGIIDIKTATLDDPGRLPPHHHIQTAERIAWMAYAHTLPEFERYPPMA